MQGFVSGTNTQKYVHYSAHDTTLQYLFSALNMDVNNPDLQKIPGLGASIILELHLVNGDYFVKMVYSNYSMSDYIPLPMVNFGCGDNCTLDLFTK
jgi:hypothetical protein